MMARASFRADFGGLDCCVAWVEQLCAARGQGARSEEELDRVGLAVFEAVGNLLEHKILRLSKRELLGDSQCAASLQMWREAPRLHCRLKIHAHLLTLRVWVKRARKQGVAHTRKLNMCDEGRLDSVFGRVCGGRGVKILRTLNARWNLTHTPHHLVLKLHIPHIGAV